MSYKDIPWYDKVSQDGEGDYEVIGRVYENGLKVHGETNFSPLSQEKLAEFIDYTNKYLTEVKVIVEIGVENNPDKNQTSTRIILDNKKDAWYFGVDLEDRDHLSNWENRIFTTRRDGKEA